MISGIVSSTRWPTISLLILDVDGYEREIEARIDTGFSNDLTLPRSVIARLGLKRVDRSNYRIGDNSTATFNTFAATIRWQDQLRRILVLESEVSPVLGVGLLWNNNLFIDFVLGGNVTITELPDTAP